ncbi:LuxR family transcriptional regulator [Knoellia aerolata]|uniref:LuxR family transcriptional regulator n=1 Tax=Knoellia aerolata DSM 18566 TaxID=1385519 RepID=A0A0A0K096_9MICO|nr:LuxR family transcriptional regulator [Knoellia aerolata]KGN41206.1 LuxR family transcriptional regulator [Knoellia aerolata DSM 18566]
MTEALHPDDTSVRRADTGDWRALVERLEAERAALREHGADLPLDELRLLAEGTWWLGDGVRSMALDEEVYRRLDAEQEPVAAAQQALDLGLEWVTRGDVVIGTAWLARAQRLLEGLPESVAHGYLLYVDATYELDVHGDPTSAQEAATRVEAVAREHGDSALPCFARVLEGFARVREGRTADGFRALDEAMLEVIAGHVPPRWAGDIYCTVIHVTHELGDWARMRSWTDALERWALPLSRTFMYATVTRVHQLQLVSAEGGWDEVVAEMEGPSRTLVGSHGWLAGAGFQELGDVLRCRGRWEDAAAAYRRARELGIDPQPGEALLAHASGRSAEAATALRAAVAGRGTLERARLLLPSVEVGLACGDVDLAETAATELAATAKRYDTAGLRAGARHAEGLLALSRGEHEDAAAALEAALAEYRSQGLRYAVARAHEHLATARRGLGRERAADADAVTALMIYRELGARPDVQRLTVSDRPGGLTAREEEVLSLVVEGASNREVAQRLVISEKTVGRHLANIFAKVDVGSRTAAAAWAHEHGIHGSPQGRG